MAWAAPHVRLFQPAAYNKILPWPEVYRSSTGRKYASSTSHITYLFQRISVAVISPLPRPVAVINPHRGSHQVFKAIFNWSHFLLQRFAIHRRPSINSAALFDLLIPLQMLIKSLHSYILDLWEKTFNLLTYKVQFNNHVKSMHFIRLYGV